jgi:hypothetical protein
MPMTSLTSNDILVTMRQFIINDIDGLTATYKECKTDEERREFIEACQHVVVNGWDNNANPETVKLLKENDFFVCVLGPIIHTPKRFFLNRTLNNSHLGMIQHFARYCLFRALFDMYKDDNIVSDIIDLPLKKNWFLTTKEKLDREFALCEFMLDNLTFKFKSPEDLADFERSLNRNSTCASILLVSAYFSLVATVGVASFYLPPLIHPLEKYVFIALARLGVNRYDKQLRATHMLFKSKLQLLSLQTDLNINKFIFLQKDEILKVMDRNTSEIEVDIGVGEDERLPLLRLA